jgi:hypothetical protein
MNVRSTEGVVMVARRKRDEEQLSVSYSRCEAGPPWLLTVRTRRATNDADQIICRFCGEGVEPIEARLDGERWWRCPHCAALLDKIEGRLR